MFEKFWKEVTAVGLPSAGPVEVIRASRLDGLPEPAKRYLSFMGVVGRPQDWSFRASFKGRFRTGPKQSWMECETWQYNTRLLTARIFHIRVRFSGILPVLARDTYLNGLGRMWVKLFDLLTLTDASGDEYDISELVTYLNDAVLLCPAMLFTAGINFAPIDEDSFQISMTDYERTVSARVIIDSNGAPVDFVTNDRFCTDPENPRKLVRAQWSTPVEGWQAIDHRMLPRRGRAVWHLASGPFEYADFSLVPESLRFNVRPQEVTK